MKKIIKLSSILFASILIFTSCNSGIINKSIDDLVIHMKQNDFDGVTNTTAYQMIGAIDGIDYKGNGFNIELYKFNNEEEVSKMIPYKNKNFGLFIHKPLDENARAEIIEVFNSFK